MACAEAEGFLCKQCQVVIQAQRMKREEKSAEPESQCRLCKGGAKECLKCHKRHGQECFKEDSMFCGTCFKQFKVEAKSLFPDKAPSPKASPPASKGQAMTMMNFFKQEKKGG